MPLKEVFVVSHFYYVYYWLHKKKPSLGVILASKYLSKSGQHLWGTPHLDNKTIVTTEEDVSERIKELIVPTCSAKCPEMIAFLSVGLALESFPAKPEGDKGEALTPEIVAKYMNTMISLDAHYSLVKLYTKWIGKRTLRKLDYLPSNALKLWKSISTLLAKGCKHIGMSTFSIHTMYIVMLHLLAIEWQDDHIGMLQDILEKIQGYLSDILLLDKSKRDYDVSMCTTSCFAGGKGKLAKLKAKMNKMWNEVAKKTSEVLKQRENEQLDDQPNHQIERKDQCRDDLNMMQNESDVGLEHSPNKQTTNKSSNEESTQSPNSSNCPRLKQVGEIVDSYDAVILPDSILLKLLHKFLLSCDTFPPQLPISSKQLRGFLAENEEEKHSLYLYDAYLRLAKNGALKHESDDEKQKYVEMSYSSCEYVEYELSECNPFMLECDATESKVPQPSNMLPVSRNQRKLPGRTGLSRPNTNLVYATGPSTLSSSPKQECKAKGSELPQSLKLVPVRRNRRKLPGGTGAFRPNVDSIFATDAERHIDGKADYESLEGGEYKDYEKKTAERSEMPALDTQTGQLKTDRVDISCYAPEKVEELAAFAVDFWIDPAFSLIEHSRHGSKRGADVLRSNLVRGSVVCFELFDVDKRLQRLTKTEYQHTRRAISKWESTIANNSKVQCTWNGKATCATVILQSSEGSWNQNKQNNMMSFFVSVTLLPRDGSADALDLGVLKVNLKLTKPSCKIENTISELKAILDRSVYIMSQPKILARAMTTSSEEVYPRPIHFSLSKTDENSVCSICTTDPNINSDYEVSCHFVRIEPISQHLQYDLSEYTHLVLDLSGYEKIAESTLDWARKLVEQASSTLSRTDAVEGNIANAPVSVYLPQTFILEGLNDSKSLDGLDADDVLLKLHVQTMGCKLLLKSIAPTSTKEGESDNESYDDASVVGYTADEDYEYSFHETESGEWEEYEVSEVSEEYEEYEELDRTAEQGETDGGNTLETIGKKSVISNSAYKRLKSFKTQSDLTGQLEALECFSLSEFEAREENVSEIARSCQIDRAEIKSQKVIIKWINLPIAVPVDQTNSGKVNSKTFLAQVDFKHSEREAMTFQSLLQELILQYTASKQGKSAPLIGYVLEGSSRFGFVAMQIAADLKDVLVTLGSLKAIDWRMKEDSSKVWSDEELGISYEVLDKLPKYDNSLPLSRDLKQRLLILHHCAQSLKSLHEVGIVHFDIAPRNILVDTNFKCSLTDFELSRYVKSDINNNVKPHFKSISDRNILSNYPRYAPEWYKHKHAIAPLSGFTTNPLTFPRFYTSPEAILMKVCTISSDVYSFGVLMAEVLLGELPPFAKREKSSTEVSTLQEIPLPCLPKSIPLVLAHVIYRCWSAPILRPEIGDIEQFLSEVLSHMEGVKVGQIVVT